MTLRRILRCGIHAVDMSEWLLCLMTGMPNQWMDMKNRSVPYYSTYTATRPEVFRAGHRPQIVT